MQRDGIMLEKDGANNVTHNNHIDNGLSSPALDAISRHIKEYYPCPLGQDTHQQTLEVDEGS